MKHLARLRFLPLLLVGSILPAWSPSYGQTVTYSGPQPSLNFGSVNVCPAGQAFPEPCSETMTLDYQVSESGTLGNIRVLTGGAPNLDFTLAGDSTCTGAVAAGSTCAVRVRFAPRFPGARNGAVQLTDGSGTTVATTMIYGVGAGPQIAFDPALSIPLGGSIFQIRALAVDGAGNLFVANDGNSGVFKVPANGGATTTVGSGLSYPDGVAVDGAGNVFIADARLGILVEVPGDGGPQKTLMSGLNEPAGVAVDGIGDVFVADLQNNRVLKFPVGGGAPTTVGHGLAAPWGLAADSAGNLLIVDSGHFRVVKVRARDGQQTLVYSGDILMMANMAVDAANNVFVAYPGVGYVVEAPGDGGPPVQLPGKYYLPYGVATDPAGNLFVSALLGPVTKVERSQPARLDFPRTPVNVAAEPQPVTIQDSGNTALSVRLKTFGPHFAQVAGAGTLIDCAANFTLAPGGGCELDMGFTPLTPGALSSATSVRDDALNAAPATQTILLSGTGVDGTPEAFVSATAIDFGQTFVGGVVTMPLGVSYTGPGTLTIAPSINGAAFTVLAAGNTCSGGITAGHSCSMTLQFSPLWIGHNTNILTLRTNGTSNPSVTLTGLGSGGTGPTTAQMSFWPIPVGASTVLPLTIINYGDNRTTATITTSVGVGYSVLTAGNTCLAGIAYGESCTLPVRFSPTIVGPQNQLLTVTATASGVGTVSSVHLFGIGTQP